MTLLRPSADNRFSPVLRAGVLLLVCALGGACNFLNTSFAVLAARANALPEEEEHTSKDRAALVAAAQPSRKGTIRPRELSPPRPTRPAAGLGSASLPATAPAHRTLTGAGIYQLC